MATVELLKDGLNSNEAQRFEVDLQRDLVGELKALYMSCVTSFFRRGLLALLVV